MKKNTILKWKSFTTAIIVVYLSMAPLSNSQSLFAGGIAKTNVGADQVSLSSNHESNSPSKEFDESIALNKIGFQDDTIKGTPDEKIIKFNDDTLNKDNQIKSIDSTKYNMFGDLLNDDPAYNKKYPIWIPMTEVLGVHIILGFNNRYIANTDFGRVSFGTWKHNIQTGWEWDSDRFGMNFLAHPYSGGLNFTNARSNGYGYWGSMCFSAGGSLMWEYFGENTLPSYNDIINTTITGAAYGEVLYRLSSNLLDDRTTGTERFFREFGAALISPSRFFNRLVQGKLTRVTTEEVYQKEPLNIELGAGSRWDNSGRSFGTGPANLMLSAQLDYGYAFEKRVWKPYDFFTTRAGVNVGNGRKILDYITGNGILAGTNTRSGGVEMLWGLFQGYDYFDNTTFELGTIAFGGGLMSKYSLFKNTYLFTNIHLGFVPLAGNSTRLGPDTSQVRDYNYGDGAELKIETGLNFGYGNIQFLGYYYWIHTYVGLPGDNYIGIIKPRITFRIYENLNVGFEEFVYYTDRYTQTSGNFHSVRTEQRFYLMLNIGNLKL